MIAGIALTALVAGCGNDAATTDDATAETPPPTATDTATTEMTMSAPGMTGGFQVPGEPATDDNACTYDEAAVPVDSVVTIDSEAEDGHTTVTLAATGLAPSRDFGVHVHTEPCGPQLNDVVVTSNLHPSKAHTIMPKTLVTAAVDRLLPHAHVVITEGTSLRLQNATAGTRGDAAGLTWCGDQLTADREISCPRAGTRPVRLQGRPHVPRHRPRNTLSDRRL